MSAKLFKLVAVVVALVLGVGLNAVPAHSAEREKHANIQISSNDQFDAAHGVRSGTGTMEHPYVISGWQLNALRIENTDRHVEIMDNTVARVVLNWIGDRVHVHGNDIGDLRVNQNVPRTGMPTSGEIAHNVFGVVGQLRHWDGIFEDNLIGTKDQLGARSVNFDGFNGARFRNNTIYGYMDARLHGHHHSSGFGEPSHQHSGYNHMEGVDHTHRYHEVWITGNRITTTAAHALIYLDTNHAANDRTAASEREPELNEPHVHYTRVHITGNRLIGAGIMVNVFNAPDKQKHLGTTRGLMEIANNRIALGDDGFWSFRNLFGIEVTKAVDVALKIVGNSVTGYDNSSDLFKMLDGNDPNAGIFLHAMDVSDIEIMHNVVSRRTFGVRAEQFTDTVHWLIQDLKTQDVGEAVHSDDSVSDSPSS